MADANVDQELWARIRAGDREARDSVILANYGLVQRHATKIHRGLPHHVALDDIVSTGVLGLIRAIDNYDPNSNVYFESYAAASIRSRILDELRTQDWAPRSLRRLQRDLEKAKERLTKSLDREPTIQELAEELEWTTDEVSSAERRIEASHHKSLDEGDSERDLAASTSDVHPGQLQRLADVIRDLPTEDQTILALRYYAQMKLSSIGKLLGLTEAKASQLHIRAVMALRDALKSMTSPED